MPTKDECKRILSKIGFKVGVSPRLIAEKLLSEDDKRDIMTGEITPDAIENAVITWQLMGLPDYRQGVRGD